MKKKILITGSSGFLGSRIALYYKDKHDLLLPTHDELNISREEAVKAYIEEHRPDVVVHCAALANTWYCEQHPDESHRVNVQGTVRVAKACKLTGTKMVFMSSDQVYNGTPLLGPLPEDTMLQPVNVYGRHKLEAEQRALWNLPTAVGLRLTWMYDLPTSRMRLTPSEALETLRLSKNLLVNLQTAHDEGAIVKAATHEYRGVTNVWDVVRAMEQAIDLPGGIYNFGSGRSTLATPASSQSVPNSHELFLEAASLLGFGDASAWIVADDERFADQPRNLSMDLARIEHHGIHFPDSVEGMERAISHPIRYAGDRG